MRSNLQTKKKEKKSIYKANKLYVTSLQTISREKEKNFYYVQIRPLILRQ